MSEADENPFRSPSNSHEPLPSPSHEPLMRPTRLRRIAGLGAYLFAAFAGFIGMGSIFALTYVRSHRQFSARDLIQFDRIQFEGLIFGWLFTVALAWAGRRLLTRPRGAVEWWVLVVFLMFVVIGSIDF
jgi:hypothetical protein